MSSSSLFLLSAGSNISPSIAINTNDSGFYLSGTHTIGVLGNGVEHLRINDSIEILKQDKNTTSDSTTGYAKLIATNENLLAIKYNNLQPVFVGILTPKVPVNNALSYSVNAEKTTWYLNNVRRNDGTINVRAENQAVITNISGAYRSATYWPGLDILVYIPYDQNTQNDLSYVDNTGVLQTYSHTIGESNGYLGGIFVPSTISSSSYLFWIPFGQSDQATWEYLSQTGGVMFVNTATNNYVGVLPKYAFSGGARLNNNSIQIVLAPYAISTNSDWYYMNGSGSLGTFARPADSVSFVPTIGLYAGLIYATTPDKGYCIPFNNTTFDLQYVNGSTGNYVTYTVSGSEYTPIAGGYVGGAYHPTLNNIYMAPYNGFQVGQITYISCADDTTHVVPQTILPTQELYVGYYGAVFSTAQNKMYFLSCHVSGGPYDVSAVFYNTNTSASGTVTGGTFVDLQYADGFYDSVNDRIYLCPFATYPDGPSSPINNMPLSYIDCATDTVVTFQVNSILSDAPDLTVYAFCGGVYDSLNNKYYYTPFNIQLRNQLGGRINLDTGAYEDYYMYTYPIPVAYPQLYYGGAISTTLNRIYYAPSGFVGCNAKLGISCPYSTWYYADLASDGLFVEYVHGTSLVGEAPYAGGAHDTYNDRLYLAPHEQGTSNTWHYIDLVTGIVVPYSVTTPAVSQAYIGAVYEPNSNRVYFIPAVQSQQALWHYIDCSTGDVVTYASLYNSLYGVTNYAMYGKYGDDTSSGGPAWYVGAGYDSTHSRIYFAPNIYAEGQVWTYISNAGTPTNYVMNTAPEFVMPSNLNLNGTYFGAVYNPIQDFVYFIPHSQANESYWHYVDDTGTLQQYLNNVTAVTNAYAGGCYELSNQRIYMAPYAQGNQANWHYIDATNGNVVAYTAGVAVTGAYIGAAYHSDLDRIYFAPFNQSNQSLWHYIDCGTGNVVTYSPGVTLSAGAFAGAIYANGYVFFMPSYVNQDGNLWYYIDDTGLVKSYTGLSSHYGATVFNQGSYCLGDLMPGLNRIYPAACYQGNYYDWSYINVLIPSASTYQFNDFVMSSNAFYGAVLSPLDGKVYFVPYGQATAANWVYVNNDLTSGYFLAGAVGIVANAYQGGAYSVTLNRIYFVPYAQANQTYWHYIDCNTGTVVSYLHGVTAVANAYSGAVYSPTQNRIYFVPYQQSNQSQWHYVDCDTGNIVAYTHGVSVSAQAYAGGAFFPTLDRVEFAPYVQGDQANWHYLTPNTVTKTSQTLSAGPLTPH